MSKTKMPPGTVKSVVFHSPEEKLKAIRRERFYKLGDPHNDVVWGSTLLAAVEVTWCQVEQAWVQV